MHLKSALPLNVDLKSGPEEWLDRVQLGGKGYLKSTQVFQGSEECPACFNVDLKSGRCSKVDLKSG